MPHLCCVIGNAKIMAATWVMDMRCRYTRSGQADGWSPAQDEHDVTALQGMADAVIIPQLRRYALQLSRLYV
jgi:hypothetical protein